MERKEGIHKKLILYFIPIFYSIGILIHLTALNEKILNYLTPISLLAINILVIAYGFIGIKKSLIWLIASYLLTFFLEVIGVKSGLVFGSYEYGNGLGLKFLDVPLIIGLNWVVVVLGATALSERISSTKIKYVLTSKTLKENLATSSFEFCMALITTPFKLSFCFSKYKILVE